MTSKKSYDISEYEKKRDFSTTQEPSGKSGKKKDHNKFSFQKHDAQTLHYDFRLACDGVLKSWSVPKGPSTNPDDKRLAIRTEDHPMDYIDFEGVIPEGNYGAGKVLLWDMGDFDHITDTDSTLGQEIENGHFKVFLKGKKIQGGYAMTRIDDEKENWLLIKLHDDEADARRNPVSTQEESVKSGRKINDIE